MELGRTVGAIVPDSLDSGVILENAVETQFASLSDSITTPDSDVRVVSVELTRLRVVYGMLTLTDPHCPNADTMQLLPVSPPGACLMHRQRHLRSPNS